MSTDRFRVIVLGVAAGLAITIPAASARAGLLDGVLPDLGQIVQDLGGTVEGLVPTGGVVTGVTGEVGGVIGGVQDTVNGTVDQIVGQVLGGSSGSGALLPTDTLDQLLAILGLSSGTGTGAGGGSAGGSTGGTGTVVVPGGSVVVDGAAPDVTVTVASGLKRAHKVGSLRLKVTSNEAGVVAVGGAIRPGKALAAKKKKSARKAKARSSAVKHNRKVIKFPAAVLAFRKGGSLIVTVKLGRTARQILGRSRNARISLATVASDLRRNQTADTVKRQIKR